MPLHDIPRAQAHGSWGGDISTEVRNEVFAKETSQFVFHSVSLCASPAFAPVGHFRLEQQWECYSYGRPTTKWWGEWHADSKLTLLPRPLPRLGPLLPRDTNPEHVRTRTKLATSPITFFWVQSPCGPVLRTLASTNQPTWRLNRKEHQPRKP